MFLGMALTTFAGPSESERDWSKYPLTPGKYNRSWESLNQWECPDWFKDAKLGIWLITGPQAVPLQGDWYAWGMYIQGHRHYEYHLKHYGHPSEFGYKDIIALYDPVKLDMEESISLYKEAGAKYVMMLAAHHDNYDLWNSKHHEWNSVNKGPGRDLAGEFAAAARKHGIRYGFSTHGARAIAWMQGSHGSDKEGPKKAVPYDGADPKYESLYCPPFEPDNEVWHRVPYNPPEWWEKKWYLRHKDLVDNYEPDLMYFDGSLPFRHDDYAVGRQYLANFFNSNMAKNNGKLEAVMNLKNGRLSDLCVVDLERRGSDYIRPYVWQTDTCIGNWYYNAGFVRRYKTPETVAFMLVDIVSKNGNLMLNIPVHPDGGLREEEIAFLKGLGEWMKINGKGIYESRPWLVYGEGDLDNTNYGIGGMHEAVIQLKVGDWRFTSKADTDVFAFFTVWPENNVAMIQSLANHSTKNTSIDSVRLLGHEGKLKFSWEREGLKVQLPESHSGHTWALHIQGKGLRNFKIPAPKQKPFKTHSMPGIIEASSYDLGGQTVAFHDTTAGNACDAARQDDVDISSKSGKTFVSSIEDGEWLEYTTDIDLGIYDISITAAGGKTGGKVTLLLDNEQLGVVDIPKDDTFRTVQLATPTLQKVRSGVIRVLFNGSGIGFESLTFKKTGMPPTITQYLSDLNWVKHDSPTERQPCKDYDRDGGPLVINGVTYEKGIGCDSQVSITYDLKGQYLRFMSDVGVDDDMDFDGCPASLKFQVYLDDQKAYDSGLMTWKTEVRKIDLDVTGAKEMKLVVDDAGNGRNSDHADWANARLVKKVNEK